MTFAVFAALAVGLLVVAPLLAHLLRRGQTREQEFPPAALVPVTASTARQRSRLEDRALLAVRAAMVLSLAVLGATPFVRCERLSLARDAGASVAFALVLDDSLSMRATMEGGSTRFERALDGARDLLRSAREGDAVAIILAGAPSRIALAATTDLRAAADTLDGLRPSDRATDLGGAVQLGRAALSPLPHVDKRVVLLSDLAGDAIPEGVPPVWAPIRALAAPVSNCAIASASREGDLVRATVACTQGMPSRSLEIVASGPTSEAGPARAAGTGGPEAGTVLATTPIANRASEQVVTVNVTGAKGAALDARLTGEDAIPHDDLAPVADRSSALLVGVVADPAVASVQTGGPTVLEQALAALPSPPAVRPLPLLPEDEAEYEKLAALFVDDPPGLTPEARIALTRWVDRGGVVLATLGPRAASAQLSATLDPFAHGGVRWEEVSGLGIDAGSLAWLGPEAQSLTDLSRRGRARLDGSIMDGAKVVGSWQDGAPWLLERQANRGAVWTVGLPVSIEASDFALRPAFVALLDRVVKSAHERRGPGQTTAGGSWVFQGASKVVIDGPGGPLQVARHSQTDAPEATPALRGRYVVRRDDEERERVVTLEPEEIFRPAIALPGGATERGASSASASVDVSREVSFVLLALFALELAFRAVRRRGGSGTGGADGGGRTTAANAGSSTLGRKMI